MTLRLLCRGKRLLLVLFVSLAIVFCLIVHRNGDDDSEDIKNDQVHRLAILVPFRDRFDELLAFVPYMTKFLLKQKISSFRIYILNQSNKYRFNRGALANVGFMVAKDHCDYIAIHDIDLLPLNTNLSYAFPTGGPYHLTSPEYHPNYNYDKYFGGILLMTNKHFEMVNGFSNRYFGWGLEDDEFYTRVKAANLQIFRPTNLSTTKNDTFLHFHYGRKRDASKTNEQRQALKYRDRVTGLKDLKYSITSQHNLTIDGIYNCNIYNVELFCDRERTPWCLPVQSKKPISKSKHI